MSNEIPDKLVHPSTILVAGPTGSGKTELVVNLIKNNQFTKPIQRIYWLYSEWQPAYTRVHLFRPEIQFLNSLDEQVYDSLDGNYNNLVILDDAMNKLGSTGILEKFFTEGSHHRNISIIYIVQNLFDKGKSHRTVSLNSQYIFLFKNPRDSGQIASIGRQMFGTRYKILEKAYELATSKPFSYLLVDLRQDTHDDYRLRSNICPITLNSYAEVYIPSK